MEINQILTVTKARKIIKEEMEKVREKLFKEIDKIRARIQKLEEEIKIIRNY